MTNPHPTGSDASVTEEMVDFVMQYGPRCRDCADEDGTCPSSGMPCDHDQRLAVIKRTIAALRYGVEHNYLSRPAAALVRDLRKMAENGERGIIERPWHPNSPVAEHINAVEAALTSFKGGQ